MNLENPRRKPTAGSQSGSHGAHDGVLNEQTPHVKMAILFLTTLFRPAISANAPRKSPNQHSPDP
jgi:hypothetical protein